MKMNPDQEKALRKQIREEVTDLADQYSLRESKLDNSMVDEVTDIMVNRWKERKGLE